MKYSKLLALLFLSFISLRTYAQKDLTMYFLNTVVQSDMVNPSYIPKSTFSTGIPFLTSTQLSFINSGFVISDIRPNSAQKLDIDNLLSKLDDQNFLSLEMQMELFTARFRIKKLYFGLSLTDKISMRLGYPKDLLQFIAKGNGSPEYLGKTAHFEGTTFDASYYHELGFSLGYKLGKFTLGARLKYLRGVANVNTSRGTFDFYTNPDNYYITFSSDMLVNTSGTTGFDNGFSASKLGSLLSGKGNGGFGTDLGATFKLNDKFTFSASMIDIGFINWSSETKNYSASNHSYTYDGVKLTSFAKNSNLDFNTPIDSMKAAFKTGETKNAYSTSLITKSYVGGIFSLTKKTQFGAMIYTEYYKSLKPAMTLSYVGNFGQKLQLAVTYSAMSKSYNNIGLGFAWNVGSAQIYSSYDNILSLFMLEKSKLFNMRVGVNMVFGRKTE